MNRPAMVSPLARIRNPRGRVDFLVARALEQGVKLAPISLHSVYADLKPVLETAIHSAIGPQTARGRKLARDLFQVRDAIRILRERGVRV